MPDREEIVKRIIECGITAVVRLSESRRLLQVAEAIREGGVDVIEFTMTTPNALQTLEECAGRYGEEVLWGAGTVLDAETARAAILAGAQFIVSPTLDKASIEMCHRYGKVAIPGTLTPNEILAAQEAGADLIKVFPARVMGPRYLHDILAPLPQVKLVPTGGVNLDTAADFIKNGAAALAVGSALVSRQAVADENFALLTETARRFIEIVKQARGG